MFLSSAYIYIEKKMMFNIPARNINADNSMMLNSITVIAVHFHEHLAAKPFRKFNGAE